MSAVRAVVDCGSNSTRLWLRPDPDEPPRHREQVTRLGQGVDATGRLDDDALERTLAVVTSYAREWRAAGVSADEVVVIATSAVRDAANRDRYVDAVVAETGVTPVVLTGDQEAAASFVGATSGRSYPDADTQVVVVDIGGGSTELVTGSPGSTEELRGRSSQVGTVRLTERTLASDPPTPAEVAAARAAATDVLAPVLEVLDLDVRRPVAVIAVAGTAATLAALDVGIAVHDPAAMARIDGHWMPAATISQLAVDLAARSAEERLELGPMDSGRADVIAAGAIILEVVVDLLDADGVTVSLRDVMDGVAALWPQWSESSEAG